MDVNKLLKSQWDRVAAIGCVGLGLIFLLVGWIGVSGTAYLAEQAPYILSGGVGGVFLLGVGATLWISADLRDEWRKLDRIEKALGDGTLRWTEAPGEPADHVQDWDTQELHAPEIISSNVTTSSPVRAKATTARRTAAPARAAKPAPKTPRTPRTASGVAGDA